MRAAGEFQEDFLEFDDDMQKIFKMCSRDLDLNENETTLISGMLSYMASNYHGLLRDYDRQEALEKEYLTRTAGCSIVNSAHTEL
jgi:hypothetical protein